MATNINGYETDYCGAGDPLVVREMVEHVPNAGSYASVAILIDESSDGVRLSYDRATSSLSSYDNAEAMIVERDRDPKVESLRTGTAA
jgi:hypothetical protein